MGKLDFMRSKPLLPLEVIVAFSAIARGLYFIFAAFADKYTVVTTDSMLYNIILGILFGAFGVTLFVGATNDNIVLRSIGLLLVSAETLFILARILIQWQTTIPGVLGNLVMLSVSIGLFIFLARGDEE